MEGQLQQVTATDNGQPPQLSQLSQPPQWQRTARPAGFQQASDSTPSVASRPRAAKPESQAASEKSPDSQPGVGWVDGLVADGGGEERAASSPSGRRAAAPRPAAGAAGGGGGSGGGVFKDGVPISVVPDDGEWSTSAQGEAGEGRDGHYGSRESADVASRGSPSGARSAGEEVWCPPPAADANIGGWSMAQASPEDGPTAVVRRAAESYSPDGRRYGEMPVTLGDLVFAFEALVQNGWVYGYKQDEQSEVRDQGWLPAAILVSPDTDLSAEEGGEAAPQGGDGEAGDGGEDWRSHRRRPGFGRGLASRSGGGRAGPPERPPRPGRGDSWRGTGRGRGGGGVESAAPSGYRERQGQSSQGKGVAKGSGFKGNGKGDDGRGKGKGRGKQASA